MARFKLPTLRRSKGTKGSNDAKRRGLDLAALLTTVRTQLRRRWQAVAILGLVLSLGVYFVLLRPASAALTKTAAEAEFTQGKVEKLSTEYLELQSAEGAALAQKRFDRAVQMDGILPADLQNVEMLSAVTRLVQASGVSLGATSPAKDSAAGPSDELRYYAFVVNVSGEYTQMVRFLDLLKSSEPLITVWSAKFMFLPEEPEKQLPARIDMQAEIRFWTSSYPTLQEIKDTVKGIASSSPTTTLPAGSTPIGNITTPPVDGEIPVDSSIPVDGSTTVPGSSTTVAGSTTTLPGSTTTVANQTGTTLAPSSSTTAVQVATDPKFATCTAAISAGYGPYTRGEDPEYAFYKDTNNDGVVCDG